MKSERNEATKGREEHLLMRKEEPDFICKSINSASISLLSTQSHGFIFTVLKLQLTMIKEWTSDCACCIEGVLAVEWSAGCTVRSVENGLRF